MPVYTKVKTINTPSGVLIAELFLGETITEDRELIALSSHICVSCARYITEYNRYRTVTARRQNLRGYGFTYRHFAICLTCNK